MGEWERREQTREDTERRLHRTGVVVVGPIVAAAVVAWGILDFGDGSHWPLTTLLWAGPAMALLFGFLGFWFGAMLGLLIGMVVGWAWGRDFAGEGLELVAAGGAAGGALGGLIVALYFAAS